MDVDGTITTGSVTLLSQPDGSALEIKNVRRARWPGHDPWTHCRFATRRITGPRIRRAPPPNAGRASVRLRKAAAQNPAFEQFLVKDRRPGNAVAFLGDDLPDISR